LVFVGPYTGLLRRLIRRFKFRGERFLARPLGGLLAQAVRELDPPHLVVPLPGSYRGFRERGFDPALLLARNLALFTGWRVGRFFRRPLLDPPRRGESWEERVKGALRLCGGDLPPGVKRVLLVDDVYTSGATARQAAQLLLQRGAEKVEVAVLARR
jgi:ComF family protein